MKHLLSIFCLITLMTTPDFVLAASPGDDSAGRAPQSGTPTRESIEPDGTVSKPEAFGPDANLASPQPEEPYQLVDLFSVEQNPGRGTLEFRRGKTVEKITLGSSSGLYGLGMVFKGAKLPFQYGKEFQDDFIIQIALGTLKSRIESQIPQFGAATLITPKVPKGATRFAIKVPKKGVVNPDKHLGLVLFSSPSTPNDLGDEYKLKNTFFAQSGTLTLSRESKPKSIDVRAQGQTMQFKLLLMKVEVDLVMGTPFSAESSSLTGTLEFPVYSPHGAPAIAFTERIAGESFVGTMGLRQKRAVSSQPKRR